MWGELAADAAGRAVDRLGTVAVVPSVDVAEYLLDDPGLTTRALAARVGATAAVTGTYWESGGALRFDLQLLDTRTGDLLSALESTEGPMAAPADLVAAVADQVAAAVFAFFDPDEIAAT